MTEEELVKIKETGFNDASIGALLLESDFINVSKKDSLILAKLQNLNDNLNLPLEDFVELARNRVEACYETSN